MLVTLLEKYVSTSMNISPNRLSIDIGNFLLSVLIAAVFFSLYRATLRDEKWIMWLGCAFASSAVENLFFWKDAPQILPSLGLTLTCLFILAAARTLRQKKFTPIPWWIWLFGLIAWASEIAPISQKIEPWHRLPMAFLAGRCLIAFGYAIYENTRNNKLAFWPFYSIAIGVVYSLGFLLRASHPALAKWQQAFPVSQTLPGNMEQLPIVIPMDNLFFAVAFVAKIGLFLAALKLLISFMVVLSPGEGVLRDVTRNATEYLDPNSKGGLLAAFGQTTGVEFASLVIKTPGRQKGEISWWGWFQPDFARKLANGNAFNDPEVKKSWPKGFSLDENLKSPNILPFPQKDNAVTGMVFDKGSTISSPDWKKDSILRNIYRQVVPNLKSFVSTPVIYQGGVIGVLSLESDRKSAFARTSIRNIQQMARFIAPTVHSRRQLQASSQINAKLNKLSKKNIKITELIESVSDVIHDVLWPESTCVVFSLGFQRVMVGRADQSKILKIRKHVTGNGKKEMDTFHGDVNNSQQPKRMVYHDRHLRVEKGGAQQTVGILVLGTFEVDDLHHPTLARDHLLQKSVSSLLFNAVIEGTEVLLSTVLNRLQTSLSSDQVSSTEEWLITLKEKTKTCGFSWIMARLSDSDQTAFFSDDPEDEAWLDKLNYDGQSVLKKDTITAISLSKPYKKANCALCLELKAAKAQLWLGIMPEDFDGELEIEHSPWRTFLERLAETASLALARIELHQLEKVTTQLEVKAFQAILQSLWLHELGNKASEMTISAGRAGELLSMEKAEKALKKVQELEKIAGNFSQVAAAINKPVKVEDRSSAYPINDVVALVHDHSKVILEGKEIQLSVGIDKDLHTNTSFPAVFLGVSNLVSNAVKAIGSKGLIKIEAQHGSSESILLHVTDSGPGISKENRSKIFRAGFSTDKNHAGAGLPGSRKVLRKCGGDLYHDHDYQKGTRFTIELPYAQIPALEEV